MTTPGFKFAAGQWALMFLGAAGAPPTPGNVTFMLRWIAAENGVGTWNPLGMNGTQNYPSLQAGISATAGNLKTNPIYAPFLAGLRAGNPTSPAALASLDKWNGNPGYGANVARTPPFSATGVPTALDNSSTKTAPGFGLHTITHIGADVVNAPASLWHSITGLAGDFLNPIFAFIRMAALRSAAVIGGAALLGFGLLWMLWHTKPGAEVADAVKTGAKVAAL